SNDKYRKEIYQCNRKFKNVRKCTTPNLTEAEIKRAFVAAWNKMLTNKSEIIDKLEAAIASMMDTSKLDGALNAQRDECAAVMELIQKCVAENASTAQNQTEYAKKYSELAVKYEAATKKTEALMAQKADQISQKEKIAQFLETLRQADDCITEYDDSKWNILLESLTVYTKERLLFKFKDGTEVLQSIE
ncbi:MAG: zinc ribbon domain-containing protein, partial [Ruthenibacterium sp.]